MYVDSQGRTLKGSLSSRLGDQALLRRPNGDGQVGHGASALTRFSQGGEKGDPGHSFGTIFADSR